MPKQDGNTFAPGNKQITYPYMLPSVNFQSTPLTRPSATILE